MVIGTRIKQLRIKNGYSQQQLGDMLGVTKVSVCGYEIGSRCPNVETLEAIAEVFKTSTDYLLGREISVTNEDDNCYVGSISSEDVALINELRHYPILYNKILKDIKRSVSIINKNIAKD